MVTTSVFPIWFTSLLVQGISNLSPATAALTQHLQQPQQQVAAPPDIQCFDSVEIREGTVLGYHFEATANGCLNYCQGIEGCQYFTLMAGDVS